MCLAHDMAESVSGDIAPHQNISKQEKHRLESEAMDLLYDKIVSLGNKAAADEIKQLWLEYEQGSSPEALICKDLDKCEMIVQALEYEKRHKIRLDSFYESTRNKFQHPVVQKWVEQVYQERDAFWQS